MEIKQIYDLTNTIVQEVLGESTIVNEDLSNLADIGTALMNANSVDAYTKSLVDHIGKMVFVTRPYKGVYASLMRDGWEFGAILEKVSMEMPDAEENESYSLQNGSSYDPNIFYQPTITARFFGNKLTTWEVPMSLTSKQMMSAFSNVNQMNSFISMIFNCIENAFTLRIDELTRRAINNMIGETIHADFGNNALSSTSGTKAVNLLYLYNQEFGESLAKADALHTPKFIKYANYVMGLYQTRLASITTLYNLDGKERFTPRDYLHYVLLDQFARASEVYLESDTYHNELVKIAGYEVVPYFQGVGSDYSFTNASSINIVTTSGDTISTDGIIGCMFDKDCVVVCDDFNRRTTTQYNGKAEFTNYWFKADAKYLNAKDEQFVVFFIQ